MRRGQEGPDLRRVAGLEHLRHIQDAGDLGDDVVGASLEDRVGQTSTSAKVASRNDPTPRAVAAASHSARRRA